VAANIGDERRTARALPLPSPVLARPLLQAAILIEGCLLALIAVAPLGGIALSISPLVGLWPWLLWPARALFGNALVVASVPPERGWPALALFAVLLLGASCAQALALLAARAKGTAGAHPLWLVMGPALVFSLSLLLLPALPSDDVFSYILYGRISVIHHANPLMATPADFPHDPFLSLVFWRDVRSVYGPVWLLLSGGVALLAERLGGSLAVYVLLFKLLGVAAHLANALLIWAILGRLAPGRQLLGTLFYAWSPLCLLEFCASGHNDAVMLTLLLLGVYCVVRGSPLRRPLAGPHPRPLSARGEEWQRISCLTGRLSLPRRIERIPWWEVAGLVAFALSVATKYVPLILLPFYLVYIARRMRQGTVQGTTATWAEIAGALAWRSGVLLGVVALTAAPYWAGPATLGALLFSPPAQQLNNSLLDAISWPLRWLAQVALHLSNVAARSLVDTALKVGALLVFVALWLRELRRARSLEGMLTAWGWVLLWYVLIASTWFWPWYVTWIVAIVALVPWGRLSVATLLLAGGALALYAFLPLHAAPIYGYRSVFAFGPVLGYLLWWAWRRRHCLLAVERDFWRGLRPRLVGLRSHG
jgi:alpha-1,6-mannosyltransferase